MTLEPILLVGTGGRRSRACIDVIGQEGRFLVKGLVEVFKEVGLQIFDYPVLKTDEGLTQCSTSLNKIRTGKGCPNNL
jgi:hypothetical protein